MSGIGWAIFLDRDGVINEPVLDPRTACFESPRLPEEVRLVPGAPDALHILRSLGVPLIVISNQPAAAKGTASLEELEAVHAEIERQLARVGARLDDYRYCFHHPQGTDPELGRACACRKPAAGLIIDAAAGLVDCDLSRSWVIGDSDVDVQAGRAVGCRTILIEEPKSAHRRSGRALADARCGSLEEAAVFLLDASRGGTTNGP